MESVKGTFEGGWSLGWGFQWQKEESQRRKCLRTCGIWNDPVGGWFEKVMKLCLKTESKSFNSTNKERSTWLPRLWSWLTVVRMWKWSVTCYPNVSLQHFTMSAFSPQVHRWCWRRCRASAHKPESGMFWDLSLPVTGRLGGGQVRDDDEGLA